ncbi:hypothetical protein [Coxiella-like endosymbiont]|nr:hypothetical protein [Coxiella-like endosymbiont]PMB54802.1 Short-chain alcohol dehydrogenase family [Coxiella-like endosymbiont]
MRNDVQAEVKKLWQLIKSENVEQISDIVGYRKDFYKLFGFGLSCIDYDKDVDINVAIPSKKTNISI